jgi:hypothetical protein
MVHATKGVAMSSTTKVRERDSIRGRRRRRVLAGTGLLIAGAIAATGASAALAATGVAGSPGYLGAAEPFAVLGGSTVTNTGAPTSVWGDVGVSPGNTIIGFQSNQVGGTQHAGDSTAAGAQVALTDAYDSAAAAPRSDSVNHAAIGGQTFLPGVYAADTSMDLTGTVTLDGRGDADAVWVFRAGSTLVTASSSRVVVINGNPCNVYWAVGSSATLGSSTSFIGAVMAQASVTAVNGATVDGRLLARTAAVTLDSTVITRRTCALTDANGTTVPAGTPSASPTGTPAPTATTTPAPTTSPTGTPPPTASPTAKPTPTASPTRSPGTGATPVPSARPTRAPSTAAPAPSSTPTASPTAPGTGGGSGPVEGTPTLATTGSEVTPPLALAGALLALGAALMAAPGLRRSIRRRRAAAVR